MAVLAVKGVMVPVTSAVLLGCVEVKKMEGKPAAFSQTYWVMTWS